MLLGVDTTRCGIFRDKRILDKRIVSLRDLKDAI